MTLTFKVDTISKIHYMKILRVLLTIFLVPVVAAFCWSFFNLLVSMGQRLTESVMPFWAGIACYFIFQAIFFKPIRTYVFGHELTHAIAGVLSGARVKSFKVASSGGSVVLTKTNIWIALAPYFIPIYMLLLIILYWAASQVWQIERLYPFFLFFAGATLSFHLSLTYYAMSQEQSDLKQFGTFLSSEIILIVNCIVLAALFRVLFPGSVDLKNFLFEGAQKTGFIYNLIILGSVKLWKMYL